MTNLGAFPSNMLGLPNHIQISNSYIMSPANSKDDKGNPKLQRPTYVVLLVATNLVGNVRDMSATCRTDTSMSANFPNIPFFLRTSFLANLAVPARFNVGKCRRFYLLVGQTLGSL
jgi:hypothetical protein